MSRRFAIGLYASAILVLGLSPRLHADDAPLDIDRYVEIVLRSNPAGAGIKAFDEAAAAERKAARLFPDPLIDVSRARGRLTEGDAVRGTENAFSITQSIPWLVSFAAEIRAADRAADALRAGGVEARWELVLEARRAFAGLLFARALVDIARSVEADARSLKDLTDRRAELGESREAERIKATVEWLRRQRDLQAAERGAEAAESILRTIALEPLPRPLVLSGELPRPIAPIDPGVLRERLIAENPKMRAAQAQAAQQQALLSAARRARIGDIDVAFYRTEELDKISNGFTIGLTIPLWNANRGEVARTTAAAALAEAAAGHTRVDLLAELEARARDLHVASGQVEIIERDILPAATRSVEIVRLSYEEGETSLLDLLDAQRTFRETQREAIEARFALALALADIQRLVGPDFDPWR
ncbi:MAG: TolC family protein [Acidobacteria bacterium]|nr:TolC family protein [Acidobacteriota bacterium]